MVRRTVCACRPSEGNGWQGYNRHVRFHRALDEAAAMAREEGKRVFYYHVGGDLDLEAC
jgi:hypothetical protein